MTIGELYELAIEYDQIDVQALIMFLVFEKQVHTFDDDVKVLDLYFLERHHERMTKELTQYKNKMNMQYPPDVYRVETTAETLYILARDMKQARSFAISNGYNVIDVTVTLKDSEFYINHALTTIKQLSKYKKAPTILGAEREYKNE